MYIRTGDRQLDIGLKDIGVLGNLEGVV